ncbi:MAG: ZIP family metal transporter [Clostridia bacterium]|nr:ZIP family metal transporter [Clostridia bacterium]
MTISPLLQSLLASLMTWGLTALGAALVIFTRRTRPIVMDGMLAFGAGVMLASSYWSLLSPAISLAEELGQSPFLTAAAGFLCGGLLLMGSDALLARLLPERLALTDSRRRSALLISSITLHNIPEGLAVGVTFGALSALPTPAALTGAWMLAVGIGLQNFPEGAAVSLPLRREGMGRGRAFFWGQASALVEPVSAVLGCLLAVRVRSILPFALAFAAGAMVVVVIAELVPESRRSARPALMTLATLLGFTVMMILDVALG